MAPLHGCDVSTWRELCISLPGIDTFLDLEMLHDYVSDFNAECINKLKCAVSIKGVPFEGFITSYFSSGQTP